MFDKIQLIDSVFNYHKRYWQQQKNLCQKFKDAYHVEFFKGRRDDYIPGFWHSVETADTYSAIESYIAALFTKSPAVEIEAIGLVDGKKESLKKICDTFLYSKSEVIQDATRLALVFPNSFLKLVAQESTDPLNRADIISCAPWDVILDIEAKNWDSMRFIGHIYYLPVHEAIEKFGDKSYQPCSQDSFFQENKDFFSTTDQENVISLPEEYLYVQIVEFYDFVEGTLSFYSRNVRNIKDSVLMSCEIPLEDYDGRKISPIVPLFFSKRTDSPLEGLSAVGRFYDQISEKNILRTFLSNSTRRDARQFLYQKGKISENQLAQIQEGIDGAMIGIDDSPLGDVIKSLEIPRTSANITQYNEYIEQDLQRSSIMAPFSRGEATKATATEVAQLSVYTASEVGKMAKVRDTAIASIAKIYLRFLAMLIEEKEIISVLVDKKPKLLSLEDLNYNLKIYAVDQGGDPVSRNIKKAEFVSLIPTLQTLGVSQEKLLEQLVTLYELPPSLLEKSEEENKRIFNIDDSTADTVNRVSAGTPAEQGALSALASAKEEEG